MSTPLDDIRNADTTALREVWKWGGYEAVHGPYPGRTQALIVIGARNMLPTDAELVAEPTDAELVAEPTSDSGGPDLHDFICAVADLLCMVWSLAFVAVGYTPDQLPRKDLASAPRARRTAYRHPFRSVVRCTAPPALWTRSTGLQVT